MKYHPAVSRILAAICLMSGCGQAQPVPVSGPISPPNQAAPAPRPGPHALLIGCTIYDNLPKSSHLTGPGNDVVLLRRLLTGARYQFPPENIVTLSEASGSPRDRPTRANIEREFRRLAEVVRPGEQVVITFSGHGSQQPDQDPPDSNDPEPDGLDEIILPADTGRWDPVRRTVKNAILDDELKVWLKRLVDRGAFILFISDSCHSGSVVRATTTEVDRAVEPTHLGVPDADMAAADTKATRGQHPRGAERDVVPLEAASQVPELVAIYAALPNEKTPEMPPLDGSDMRRYGLLTYTLCKVVTTAVAPLSYVGLVQRVQGQYAAWGRNFPTPLVEGKYRDREVLGVKEGRRDTRILLSRKAPERLTIAAGALHGLTPGSILSVSSPAGERESAKPIGHVIIKPSGLGPFESEVEPVQYGGDRSLNLELPDGGRCVPVFIDFGDMRLNVAVREVGPKEGELAPGRDVQRRVGQILKAIESARGSLIKTVENPAPDDWVIRVEPGRDGAPEVFLAPASGWVAERSGAETSALFGPAPRGDALKTWLEKGLERIARARHLIRLASEGSRDLVAADSDVDIRVELLKYRDRADRVGQVVEPGPGGTVLVEGEIVAFRIRNASAAAIDATILHIDSGEGIKAFFPEPKTIMDNRLSVGKSLTTRRFRVNRKTLGTEHIIVIAVTAKGEPIDFSALEQPTLERAREADVRGVGALNSPLGNVLRLALFGEGNTRGLDRSEFDDYALRLISWRTMATDPGTR